MSNKNIEHIKNDDNNISLGGFPPIMFINNETKKKREFREKVEDNINVSNINKLNILNIKNILGEKK